MHEKPLSRDRGFFWYVPSDYESERLGLPVRQARTHGLPV